MRNSYNLVRVHTNTRRLFLLVTPNQAGTAVRLVVDAFCIGVLTDARDLLFSFSLRVGLEPPLRLPCDERLVFGRTGVTGSRFDALR